MPFWIISLISLKPSGFIHKSNTESMSLECTLLAIYAHKTRTNLQFSNLEDEIHAVDSTCSMMNSNTIIQFTVSSFHIRLISGFDEVYRQRNSRDSVEFIVQRRSHSRAHNTNMNNVCV